MSNNDLLHRFIFNKLPIRGEFIKLTKSYQDIANQHSYPFPLRQLLGEALCVAGLLCAIIKFTGKLTVQFRGKGKLKLLLAQCNNKFQMRGLVKWEGDFSYPELMAAMREGVLVIMLDSDETNRYQGIVSWEGNSLAESIEGYFRNSEQLETKIWLNVNETTATGLLLQIVPAKQESLEKADWKRLISLSDKFLAPEYLTLPTKKLLRNLYPEDDLRLFKGVPTSFYCTCSRQRGDEAIALLGKEEAEEELAEKQNIVVTCEFCNQEYTYDRVDVAKIFKSRDKPASDTQLH